MTGEDWIDADKELPIIAEGEYLVEVLIVTYDKLYAELCADKSKAISVEPAVYGYVMEGSIAHDFYSSEKDFMVFYFGGEHGAELGPVLDSVLFWKYYPTPPPLKEIMKRIK